MAVRDAGETAGKGETINPATGLANSAAVSAEESARQTDRDVATLSWTSLLVRAAPTVPDYSSSE